MKRIILCADDYGQNMAVSQGIIALCKLNRLSAVSCMAHSSYWSTHAEWLKPFKDKVDVGLHFNLTEGRPLSRVFRSKYGNQFPDFNSLVVQSYMKRIDKNAVEVELHAQLEEFVKYFHRPPNFIDGHQHVHQFPIIREVILELYERNLRSSNTFIRSTCIKNYLFQLGSGYFKKILIQVLGSRVLEKKLLERKILHNTSFGGIYNFSAAKKYAHIFPKFLQASAEGGLIMCHPGLLGDEQEDNIAKARFYEYNYFANEAFLEACSANQITLSRFIEV